MLLVATGVVFLVVGWSRFTAPFGDSHDGRNAGVWATGSRAIREDGLLASRLGGRHPDGTAYANHPPLILLETAAVEAVAGERPWATRAPAVLSTLASIALLYVILREARVRAVPAALGVGVAVLSPMVLVFGGMLDTPVTSTVAALALVWAWQRSMHDRAVPVWAMGLLAALACFSGWEATLLTWLAAIVLLASRWRRSASLGAAVRAAAPLLVGAAVGTGAGVAWSVWVYGSPVTLYDELVTRSSGTEQIGRIDSLGAQVSWAYELFGPALIGLLACVAAIVVDRRNRALFALTLGCVALYSTVLFNGAGIHSYWNYWLWVPVGLGTAWALDRLWSGLRERDATPLVAAGLTSLFALALIVANVVTRTPSQQIIEAGAEAGRLAATAPFSPAQGSVGEIGDTAQPEAWLSYYARLPTRRFESANDFLAWADQHTDALVLVSPSCPATEVGELCRTLQRSDPDGGARWQLRSAGELAARYRATAGR